MSKCCPVMKMALDNPPSAKAGLQLSQMFNTKSRDFFTAPIIYFKRVKKGEPFAGATYAPVKFCPFCGAKQETGQVDCA
jgi:hypothetical protein